MTIPQLVSELASEVEAILSSSFKVEVTRTQTVPHSDDSAITFPNLDDGRQGTKLLSSCVLYIDIRRSTELNLSHRPQTVSKLYSAFVRAMTRCARYHGGHVRGIIGDRVMVIFDPADAFKNAVECAISMNSAAQHVVNKYFKAGEVLCGIGIDVGNMLVTKTGIRKRGVDQASYRNLVWLGRPANVASKLTDLANKTGETVQVPMIYLGRAPDGISQLTWEKLWPSQFLRRLAPRPNQPFLEDSTPDVREYVILSEDVVLSPSTPAILMTEAVWNGFKSAVPSAPSVLNNWISPVEGLRVPGYSGTVFGGDITYNAFRDR